MVVDNISRYIPSVLKNISPLLAWYACDLWIAASASAIDAFESPVLMVEIQVRQEGGIERVQRPGFPKLAV